MIVRLTAALLTGLALLVSLPGCASLAERGAAARNENDAALAADAPPDGAWLVVADGKVVAAASADDARARAPEAAQRYVFRPDEAGDRRLRIAYVPAAGVVAGQGLARELGLRLRRGTREGVVISRDIRRVQAGDDAAIVMRLESPDRSRRADVRVVLDPEFDGALLLSPAVADALELRRFEIPGITDVHVALGRPFFARRVRVHVVIPALGSEGDVEAVHPRR